MTDFSLLHMVCHTPDISPRTYPRRREIDELMAFVDIHASEFMSTIPEQWDDVEYGEFLGEVKGASILKAWIEEKTEDEII